MIRILVVDDEPQILRALRINLRARDYQVDTAVDGTQALHTASVHHPDLVILDLGLPDMSGTDVIHGLRGWTDIPIIVLSGRAGSHDKVQALDAGADDYITKPFGIDELLARIRAATRRRIPTDAAPAARIGDHVIDLTTHTVSYVGEAPDSSESVHLTRTEWQLLEILLRNPGKLLTGSHLLTRIWGPTYETQTNYLRQYMAQLRRKLELNPSRPQYLLTEPGIGYRYRADGATRQTRAG